MSLFVQILNQPSIHLLDNFISLRIRGQNRNCSKGFVRDLCRNDLPKNIGKSGSLACPFKYIGSVATYILVLWRELSCVKSPKARQRNPRIAGVIYAPKVEYCSTTFSQYLALLVCGSNTFSYTTLLLISTCDRSKIFVQNK